jgi:hypothetical protein
MKSEIARGLFLMGALGVVSLAAAAWHEPGPGIVRGTKGLTNCPIPPNARERMVQVKPGKELLLVLYGLSQGLQPHE